MITTTIQPRFSDTDALGHISNTTFAVWFEEGRTELFRIFHPSLDVKTWPLIIARTEFDFIAQTYWGRDIEIKTSIRKLGTSSCHIIHEAFQDNQLVAKGLAVMIYFDYTANQSVAIPEDIRNELSKHLTKAS
jgi:acyl-CoA thioester hydrolase